MILDFKTFIFENIQQAEKYYFNNGKITGEHKDKILEITNGDNYTKMICDMYQYMVSNSQLYKNMFVELSKLYNDLKNYNKNVFPINNLYNLDACYLIEALETRRKTLKMFADLPSIAKRNLKKDIKEVRSSSQLIKYYNELDYVVAQLKLISNRPEKIQNAILRKSFKSNTTLDEISDFFEDKQNLIKDFKLTKNKALQIAKENHLDIVYDKDNILILKVEDLDGIKAIGFMSLQCFTYGNSYREQSNYSTNGIVYVIINYNEPYNSEYFMSVLIQPINEDEEYYEGEYSQLFNILNEPISITYIESFMALDKAKELMNFGEEFFNDENEEDDL